MAFFDEAVKFSQFWHRLLAEFSTGFFSRDAMNLLSQNLCLFGVCSQIIQHVCQGHGSSVDSGETPSKNVIGHALSSWLRSLIIMSLILRVSIWFQIIMQTENFSLGAWKYRGRKQAVRLKQHLPKAKSQDYVDHSARHQCDRLHPRSSRACWPRSSPAIEVSTSPPLFVGNPLPCGSRE